jgi:two-component system response regulator DesR
MIRTLLALDGALVCGALAHVLSAEPDIEVVAQLGRLADVEAAVLSLVPDVAVVDLALLTLGGLTLNRRPRTRLAGCSVLVLAEAQRSGALAPVIARPGPGIGFVAKDGPPERLVEAVRLAAGGQPVVDPELISATGGGDNPLTAREQGVLTLIAEDLRVKEIANRLSLSPGTVRNHVSRILAKTGANTRHEAVRIARNSRWI